METVHHTLKAAMLGYTRRGLNAESVLTTRADGRLRTVVSLGRVRGETVGETGLSVRLLGDRIVIDRGNNNTPLVDTLVQAGVPQEQSVLTDAGVTIPHAA